MPVTHEFYTAADLESATPISCETEVIDPIAYEHLKKECLALEARVREVEVERDAAKDRLAKTRYPDFCPFTGLRFFMVIESPEGGAFLPTYGGPYDSYTIPERDESGDYTRRRYDHDLGGWLIDEVESLGVRVVEDWKVPDLEDKLKQAESDLAAARAMIEGLISGLKSIAAHGLTVECKHRYTDECQVYLRDIAADLVARHQQ